MRKKSRSFSGLYFFAFGMNLYPVRMREKRARETPNTDTYHTMIFLHMNDLLDFQDIDGNFRCQR